MKLATFVLLGIPLLGSYASLNAQPAGSQVVMAYINETPLPDPLPGFDGLCLVYYTMVGDLDLKSLFMLDTLGNPQVDREHAYFIWVSDYKAQNLPANKNNKVFAFTMILQGTATIYYTNRPDLRNWADRRTWGAPVATFVRKTGMFQSTDNGKSGTFVNTAEFSSSTPFTLPGQTFDFKNLIPNGMTCFETIAGWYEAGTCVAIGPGQ